ncbi:hypothetical protein C8R43DRAFT_583235 [Mycena crocata]|nr:hypothetical protein C8R43DRAFT_583235 [Mycena crocata]
MPVLSGTSSTRSGAELLVTFGKRDAPRIGGSEGGFIALVVGLGVVILGSCVAIFILLRDHSPSDREREARREERRRYPSASETNSNNNYGSLSAKLGGMFGLDGTKRTKGGHGWIQASGDAWEADEAERSREMRGLGNSAQTLDAPFRPPTTNTDPYAPPSSYSSDSIYEPQLRYTPVSRSTLTLSTPIPRSASPDSTETAQPTTDNPSGRTQSQNRHFSIESATSVRTFEGGTKFIEGL